MSDPEIDLPAPYADLLELLAALPFLVREKRRRCGLSLRAAVAEMDGVTFSSLHRFEHGSGVDLATAMALLKWVGEPAASCPRCGSALPVDETAVTT